MLSFKESLKNIREWEPHIHAFVEVFENPEENEQKGLFTGVPVAIKANICTVEGKTTAASRMLEGFTSPFDATVVKRLKDEGAVIVGKTNLDEFAFGASTEYSAVHVTENPWDTSRVAGGSSGGSAAAVASGEARIALGTDTGGSVRHPASFCGIVGLRPTYGRASRFGLIAYGSSLDTPGILSRTVGDAALTLECIAGQDTYDATTSPELVGNYIAACDEGVSGVTIGVPKEYFGEGIDEDVARIVREAIDSLQEAGAQVREISLPLTNAGIPVYYLLAKAEASSNLARYDGMRFWGPEVEAENLIDRYMKVRGEGFGPEVKRSIMMGTYALSAGYHDAWYKQASRVRTLIRREFEQAFETVDVILGPTTPTVAFPIGEKSQDPLAMYLADVLTVPASIAGIPAMSIPCGFVYPERSRRAELPVGLQITAPHFGEEVMFRVAGAYERAHDWHKNLPERPKE